ncbi:MAG: hypothetical protein IKB51_00335 [Clostridia bacterium]|nr:hypothetical protein [Clostridia bacterium]
MKSSSLFILRSLTAVMKAKKLLAESGIVSTAVKRTSHSGEGCHYGISVSVSYAEAALNTLKRNGIYPQSIEHYG